MSSEIRQQRVAGLLFEEMSIMLAGELADPRISLVTVTDVRVSKDLRNARIFVSHQDEEVRGATCSRHCVARRPLCAANLPNALGCVWCRNSSSPTTTRRKRWRASMRFCARLQAEREQNDSGPDA